MNEKNWECTGSLMNHVDNLLEKMRMIHDPRLEYDHGKEQIEVLCLDEIRRMAEAENALERILFARASYKAFVVTSYLSGRDYDFGWSIWLLEDTLQKARPDKLMSARPRFLEKFFQSNV